MRGRHRRSCLSHAQTTDRYWLPSATRCRRRTSKSSSQSMGNVRRSRLRTGGHSWRLYHSVGQPDIFLERFTVASWSEFERQRTERWLDYDSEGVTRAISYTVDNARHHEYYLARRVPR